MKLKRSEVYCKKWCYAASRPDDEVYFDEGTIIWGGNYCSVTIETGGINCEVRLGKEDYISEPCYAQVSFKRGVTGTLGVNTINNRNNVKVIQISYSGSIGKYNNRKGKFKRRKP